MVRFVVFAETSSKYKETWLWFLQRDGNEGELRRLSIELNRVNQELVSHLSVYSLDVNNSVSEETAREMCALSYNKTMKNRMFYGLLPVIPFKATGTQQSDITALQELFNEGKIRQFFNHQ